MSQPITAPNLTETTHPSVGQYLLDRLQSLGVDHIFGIPGDYILRFDKMIEDHPIQFINTTRENTAGFMADAYSRLKGIGVACITYGVGMNIVNALAQAYVESSPVVVISGAAGQDEFLRCKNLHHLINTSGETSDMTQLNIFKHVTIGQAILNNPNTAATEIDRILSLCIKEKKPVYIELPRDVVDMPITPPASQRETPKPKSSREALNEALEEVAMVLKESKRPCIWLGHEIHRFGLVEQALQFAEAHNIPIATSLLGKTTFSEKHPLFVGVYQGAMSRPEVQKFVESCDTAIMLGTMLNDVNTGIFTSNIPEERRIVVSNERIKISHHQYRNLSFADFMVELSHLQPQAKYPQDFPVASNSIRSAFAPEHDTKITTSRVFECIQSQLSGDNVVISDIGDCLFGCTDLLLEERSFIACAYFCTLGFATPGAVAVQLAEPQKRVIAVVGDGAFQMTCTELSTAVRYGLNPIVIVLNNKGYGTERPLIEGEYNDILNWKYHEMPHLLGNGVGIKAHTEDIFYQALSTALNDKSSFYLIEVELDKTDFSPAMKRFADALQDRIG